MEIQNKKSARFIAFLFFLLTLVFTQLYGCGGGGDGNEPPQPPDDTTTGVQSGSGEKTDSPRIIVGKVYGNTSTYGSLAEFSVELATPPANDVTIEVTSSTPGEGEVVFPKDKQIVFPAGSTQHQTVRVAGRNNNVPNLEQNYYVVLSPAKSNDSAYDGIDPDDVLMEGLGLQLHSPKETYSFIAGLQEKFSLETNYTGKWQDILSYSLVSGPSGIKIDNSGTFSWIPDTSDEGKTYPVSIQVSDGNIRAQADFFVRVSPATEIETRVNGNTLTVTDPDSSFNGMVVTTVKMGDFGLSAEEIYADISSLSLYEVPYSTYRSAPEGDSPLTNVLVIKNDQNFSIELKVPASKISAAPGEVVSLLTISGNIHSPEYQWGPASFLRYIKNSDSSEESFSFFLSGLSGSFLLVSYEVPNNESSSDGLQAAKVASSSNSSCKDMSHYISCTDVSSGVLSYLVGPDGKNPQLSKAEKIYNIITDSDRLIKSKLNLTTSGKIMVAISRKDIKYGDAYLYTPAVKKLPSDLAHLKDSVDLAYNTIIMSDSISSDNDLKDTISHEYMHHAQAMSGATPETSLHGGNHVRGWFIEGMAEWFVDYLYDQDNFYLSNRNSRILENGLHISDTSINEGYAAFSFWKMVSSRCDYYYKDIFIDMLNFDHINDPYRISRFSASLKDSLCDTELLWATEDNGKLAALLLIYQWASLKENKLSLLDSNEPDSYSFPPTISFSETISNNDPWHTSIEAWIEKNNSDPYILNIERIPAASAFSFFIEEIEGTMPDGGEALLKIKSAADQDLYISILPEGEELSSNKHVWARIPPNSTWDDYVIPPGEKIPKTFVTIINASTETTNTVNARSLRAANFSSSGAEVSFSITQESGFRISQIEQNENRPAEDSVRFDHTAYLHWRGFDPRITHGEIFVGKRLKVCEIPVRSDKQTEYCERNFHIPLETTILDSTYEEFTGEITDNFHIYPARRTQSNVSPFTIPINYGCSNLMGPGSYDGKTYQVTWEIFLERRKHDFDKKIYEPVERTETVEFTYECNYSKSPSRDETGPLRITSLDYDKEVLMWEDFIILKDQPLYISWEGDGQSTVKALVTWDNNTHPHWNNDSAPIPEYLIRETYNISRNRVNIFYACPVTHHGGFPSERMYSGQLALTDGTHTSASVPFSYQCLYREWEEN